MNPSTKCLCGHPWSQHTTPRMPSSGVPTCNVFGCRCQTPSEERLSLRNLAYADRLRCVARYEGKMAPRLDDFTAASGSMWNVKQVASDHVLLEAESTGETLSVLERELHLYFERA